MVDIHCRDHEQAKEYLQEGVRLARQIGLRRTICTLLNNLSLLDRTFGDYIQAEKYLQESLALARETGLYWLICEALFASGELFLTQLHFEAAFANFQQAVEASAALNASDLKSP